MIGNARIVAIEGAHGTGKTTLAYAVAAELAESGHPINLVGEVVRHSPWFQDALLRGDGTAPEVAFVHLFADQLRRELEATRHASFVVLDRSVLSCLGYWHLQSAGSAPVLAALEAVAEIHTAQYDLVVYCEDMYPLVKQSDPFRNTDEAFRQRVHESIASVVARSGANRVAMPKGLGQHDKVRWVVDELFPPSHDA